MMSGIMNDILDSSQNAVNSNEFVNNQIEESSVSENLEIESTNSIQEENMGGQNTQENAGEKIELTQMEQDAKDILDSKSLIIPLKGTITSRFGLRNPETPTVPKNHTGIDIAVNEGTVFVAAMSGLVEGVSNERRFRKSF